MTLNETQKSILDFIGADKWKLGRQGETWVVHFFKEGDWVGLMDADAWYDLPETPPEARYA